MPCKRVLQHLPIRKLQKERNVVRVFPHHGLAGSVTGSWDQWNQDIRMLPIDEAITREGQPCSIWEVGANMKAAESRELFTKIPIRYNCQYHAYEPVPMFFTELTNNWANDMHPNKGKIPMTLHNYGLGSKNLTLTMPTTVLDGEGTFLGGGGESSTQKDDTFQMEIRTFDYAVQDAKNQIPTVLQINCEGCEWEMIPQMLDEGFIQRVPIVNLGTHNYPVEDVGKKVIQYCRIHQRLSRTHNLHPDSMPFAWEKWTIKQKDK